MKPELELVLAERSPETGRPLLPHTTKAKVQSPQGMTLPSPPHFHPHNDDFLKI